MTRVAVVEDHVLVRQSLVKAVATEPGFDVVAQAGSADEAMANLPGTRPEVVLLDVGLPGADGFEVAAQLKQKMPEVRIVFLTMYDDDTSIKRAVAVGADGFLPKTAEIEELMGAIRIVAGGGTYLSPAVARRVMALAGARPAAGPRELTDRETQILRLLADGLHHDDIAEQLFVSAKTIKNHLTSIYVKLGVKSAAQAVAAAYRTGIVPRPMAG